MKNVTPSWPSRRSTGPVSRPAARFVRFNKATAWARSDPALRHKVIIVDGLLAFKGSANMTVTGWLKTAQGQDLLEIVTHVMAVAEINNRDFSPLWARDDRREAIEMVAG